MKIFLIFLISFLFLFLTIDFLQKKYSGMYNGREKQPIFYREFHFPDANVPGQNADHYGWL
jgi:hypothetical protein